MILLDCAKTCVMNTKVGLSRLLINDVSLKGTLIHFTTMFWLYIERNRN